MGASMSSPGVAAGAGKGQHGKDGRNWSSKVYFAPEADQTSGKEYNLSHNELNTRLQKLIGLSEKILTITVYTHRLYDWQFAEGLMFHAYVVLQTDGWFWSIEKNDQGVTIQRSTHEAFVKNKYRRGSRPSSINEHVTDAGKYCMTHFVHWMHEQEELYKGYDWQNVDTNCKGFAKRIFDNFAKNKFCEFVNH